jgi:hypothetical protein
VLWFARKDETGQTSHSLLLVVTCPWVM